MKISIEGGGSEDFAGALQEWKAHRGIVRVVTMVGERQGRHLVLHQRILDDPKNNKCRMQLGLYQGSAYVAQLTLESQTLGEYQALSTYEPYFHSEGIRNSVMLFNTGMPADSTEIWKKG